MQARSIVAAVAIIGGASPALAQEPTYSRADVEAAISIGVRGRVDRIQHNCTARLGGSGGFWGRAIGAGVAGALDQAPSGQYNEVREYRITGQPPMARVAEYANGASRRYQPVPEAGDDGIAAIIADDVFTVWADPETDGNMIAAAQLAETGVEHMVIRRRGDNEGETMVQPLSLELASERTVSNLFGSSVELQGIVATFASADVRAIAERGDVEAILITTAGEFKCNLDDTRIKRGYNPQDND